MLMTLQCGEFCGWLEVLGGRKVGICIKNVSGRSSFGHAFGLEMWQTKLPNLGRVKEIPDCSVFVICVYSGDSKPSPLSS